MTNPHKIHPAIYEEFIKRKLTVQKTKIKFSKRTLDHNHEQINAKIKGVRGAICLTENKRYLQRWLICGSKISCILDEIKGTRNITSNVVPEHHKSTISAQSKRFKTLFASNR